jgi:hypothetical protein
MELSMNFVAAHTIKYQPIAPTSYGLVMRSCGSNKGQDGATMHSAGTGHLPSGLADAVLLPDPQRLVLEPRQQRRLAPRHAAVDPQFVDPLYYTIRSGALMRRARHRDHPRGFGEFELDADRAGVRFDMMRPL